MSFSLTQNWAVHLVLFLMGMASIWIVAEGLWVMRGSVAIGAISGMARIARDDGVSPSERRWMLRRIARSIHHDLGRSLGTLLTVAVTAPLVGVLGTIAGLLRTLHAAELVGQFGLGALSLGFAESLLPFAYALLVGVPSLWAHTYLQRRRDRVTLVMERALLEAEVD